MIPQTIPTDTVVSFQKYLTQQGSDLDALIEEGCNSTELLTQVLSAWEKFRVDVLKMGNDKIVLLEDKEPHGYERIEQLKKEN